MPDRSATGAGTRAGLHARGHRFCATVLALIPTRFHHQREILAGLVRACSGRPDLMLLHHGEEEADSPLAWRPDAAVVLHLPATETRLRRHRVPLLVLDDERSPLVIDEEATGRAAVAHLRSRGYPRLALLAPPQREQEARLDGFRAAADRAGLPCHALASPWPGTSTDLLAAVARLGRDLSALPPPVGVFCLNDNLAWMAMVACRRLGLAVPEAIGILGAGDDPSVAQAGPVPVSSVLLPHRRLGELAGSLLPRLLAGRPMPARSALAPAGVAERASTALPRLPDPALALALAWISSEAGSGIGVDAVAAAVGLPRRSLERRFQRSLGSTVLEEIHRAQLRRGQDALRRGTTVRAAASAAGLSPSAFAEAFSQATGLSPGEWRKRIAFLPPE